MIKFNIQALTILKSQFKGPLINAFPFSETEAKFNRQTEMIMEKLKQHADRSRQLEQYLIDSALGEQKGKMINPEKARMQINKKAPFVAKYEELKAVLKNIQDLNQMKQQTTDKEEKQMLKEEAKELDKQQEDLEEEIINMLIPPDLYDDFDEVTLEFRAGAGGSESSLFVEDFSTMILNYCNSMGWRSSIQTIIRDSSINRGYRIMNVKVQGPEVYRMLKCESGVHKVIRVPQTQSKGRLHSSTISMVVMPSVPLDFSVSDKDIRYEYMRSSGPGGQSVNKTQSACRAVHIPTGMSVMIQEDRSQERNRKRATDLLKQRLFEIEYKKNVEQQSRNRKSQIGTMDRSEKIRTYNYPQDRITDHRTGLTLYGIDSMMSGEYLPKFIQAYQDKIHEEKLKNLLEELKGKKTNSVV